MATRYSNRLMTASPPEFFSTTDAAVNAQTRCQETVPFVGILRSVLSFPSLDPCLLVGTDLQVIDKNQDPQQISRSQIGSTPASPKQMRVWTCVLSITLTGQIALKALNAILLAPICLQMTHLLGRNPLAPARTRVRRSVACRPRSGRSVFSEGACGRKLGSCPQDDGPHQTGRPAS